MKISRSRTSPSAPASPPGRSACGSSATASPSRGARPRATAATPTRTSSCCAASLALARGRAVRPRRARARPRDRADRPALDLRRHRLQRRPSPRSGCASGRSSPSPRRSRTRRSRRGRPVIVGAFQRERNYRAVEHRYRRMAQAADVASCSPTSPRCARRTARPVEIPIRRRTPSATSGRSSSTPRASRLPARRGSTRAPRTVPDGDRRFEAVWTLDPQVVRRAALVGGALAGRVDPRSGVASRRAARPAARPRAPGAGASSRSPTG